MASRSNLSGRPALPQEPVQKPVVNPNAAPKPTGALEGAPVEKSNTDLGISAYQEQTPFMKGETRQVDRRYTPTELHSINTGMRNDAARKRIQSAGRSSNRYNATGGPKHARIAQTMQGRKAMEKINKSQDFERDRAQRMKELQAGKSQRAQWTVTRVTDEGWFDGHNNFHQGNVPQYAIDPNDPASLERHITAFGGGKSQGQVDKNYAGGMSEKQLADNRKKRTEAKARLNEWNKINNPSRYVEPK